MSELEQLLVVQGLDTRADQLRHRLTHDPLVAERDGALAAVAAAEREITGFDRALDAIAAVQATHEREAAEHEAKIAKVSEQLYGDTVTAHKDLEALQHEIGTLEALQRAAEDRVIEQMELAEPVDADRELAVGRRTAAAEALESAEHAVSVMEAEVGAELDRLVAEREALAAGLPERLLSTYERIRTGAGGTAVAVLAAGGRCEGCHLTLARAEYDQIKRAPADDVVTCPECGRILVR